MWFGIRSSSADVRAINIHTVGEGTGFTLVDNVDGETYEFSVTIPTAGVHTVYDALAAYTAATRLGLERARAAVRWPAIRPPVCARTLCSTAV